MAERKVKEAEVERYLATGDWVRGKLPMGPRGPIEKLQRKKWVHKGTESRFVDENELQSYLADGWQKGRGKLK